MKIPASLLATCLLAPAFLAAQGDPALETVVVPSVEFAETPMADAVEFLVQRSRELDTAEGDQGRKGVNVVLLGDFDGIRLTLRISNVPLGEILNLVAEMADAKVEIGPEVVVIMRGDSYEAVKRDAGSEPLEAKLHRIMIPSIEFQDTPLRDALEFLQQRSAERDQGAGKETPGTNIVLKNGPAVTVSLRLKGVSLYTALEMTARAAGHKMEIREHLVFVSPVAEH